jgi:hypothetical protein
MNRIPAQTIDSMSAGARAILERFSKRSLESGHLLNLHAEMAHAPAVLAAYAGFRQAIETYGTFTPLMRSAIMLTVSAAHGNAYTGALNLVLACRAGWSEVQAAEIRAGRIANDDRLTAMLAVAREAAAHGGSVDAARWMAALDAGWTNVQLAELFVYVGLTTYIDGFTQYAATELDVPSTL